jgi:hypothetical protein
VDYFVKVLKRKNNLKKSQRLPIQLERAKSLSFGNLKDSPIQIKKSKNPEAKVI